ncbi:MAG: hypothetical protein ACRC2T_17200, partial [Thermoguttaceae bacterium]
NFDNGAAPRFRIALAGTAALEEKFAHPKLSALNQWVVSRSYLDSLTKQETAAYISWQLGNVPIFENDAYDVIFKLTDGVPRLINQLCDQALMFAAEQYSKTVSADLVNAAWNSLLQIHDASEIKNSRVTKTPFEAENADSATSGSLNSDSANSDSAKTCYTSGAIFDDSSVVEFGTLDDDTEISSVSSSFSDEHEPEVERYSSQLPGISTAQNIPAKALENDRELENNPRVVEDFVVCARDEAVNEHEFNCVPEEPEKEFLGSPPPVEIWDNGRNENVNVIENGIDSADNSAIGCVCEEKNNTKETVSSAASTVNKSGAPQDHVYQSRTFYESAYPNGPASVMENWTSPGHRTSVGTGTSYRDILYRNLSAQNAAGSDTYRVSTGNPFAQQNTRKDTSELTAQNTQQSVLSEIVVPPEVVVPLGMVFGEAKIGDSRCVLPGYNKKPGTVSPDYLSDDSSGDLHNSETQPNEKTARDTTKNSKAKTVTEHPVCAEILVDVWKQNPTSDLPSGENGGEGSQKKIVRLHLAEHYKPQHKIGTSLDENFDEEIPVKRTHVGKCHLRVDLGEPNMIESSLVAPHFLKLESLGKSTEVEMAILEFESCERDKARERDKPRERENAREVYQEETVKITKQTKSGSVEMSVRKSVSLSEAESLFGLDFPLKLRRPFEGSDEIF